MATSGSSDFNMTRNEIIESALLDLGALAIGDTPSADHIEFMSKRFNVFMKSLQTDQIHVHAIVEDDLTLVVDQATYSVGGTDSVRWFLNVWKEVNGGDVDIPYTYDKDAQTITLTTIPTEVSTIKYSYERVIEDVDSVSDNTDFPVYALEMLITGLVASTGKAMGRGLQDRMADKQEYIQAKRDYLVSNRFVVGTEIKPPNLVI